MADTIQFNIVGLDDLFSEQQIPCRSILALCGGPGTGKTTLAIQMLYSLEIVNAESHRPPASTALITFDASYAQVLAVTGQFEFEKNYPKRNINIVHSLDKFSGVSGPYDVEKDITKVLRESLAEHFDPHSLSEREVKNDTAHGVFEAIERILTEILTKLKLGEPRQRFVIVLDGLSTVLSYVPEEKRRLILHSITDRLRQEENLGLAILTFELPSAPPNQILPLEPVRLDSEHYLADVVFWLMVKESIPGKRRRILEVVKARRSPYPLGEHSIWLISPKRLGEFQSIPLQGLQKRVNSKLKPGFVVFPAHKTPHDSQSDKNIAEKMPESTGIPCLDEMFGTSYTEDISPPSSSDKRQLVGGIFKGSATTVVGSCGSGKTLLALAFALGELEKGKSTDQNVLFCSFDTTEKELLKTYGNFRPPSYLNTKGEEIGNPMTLREANATGQVRLFYRSPDNFDANLFFWLLSQEIDSEGGKIKRIILDGISEIERTYSSVQGFQDFMTNLVGLLKGHQITALFTYEGNVDLSKTPAHHTPLSYITDNVIVLNQIPINDCPRKCLTITKSRGQSSLNHPREFLIIADEKGETMTCHVASTFNEYSQLLRGRPEPVEIHLRLFGENQKEHLFNQKFVQELQSRYPKIKYSTFTRTDLRDILWEHRGVARSQALSSDIMVVSIDEPWFPWLALRQKGPSLSPLEGILSRMLVFGDYMEEYRKEKLQNIFPQVMLTSCIKNKFYGLPNYYDMGFLFYRSDILEKHGMLPPEQYGVRDEEIPNFSKDKKVWSFYQTIKEVSKRSRMFGFAFDTTCVDNMICLFIELCWNYGAIPDFLLSGSFGYLDNKSETYRKTFIPVQKALEFLAWGVYHRYIPFPCDTKTMSESVFCRHWYSTFIDMITLSPPKETDSYAIMKFPVDTDAVDKISEDVQGWVKDRSGPLNVEGERSEVGIFIRDLRQRYADEILCDVEITSEGKKEYKLKPGILKGGWTCSGTWFTGVLRSGRSVDPGWTIAYELINPSRMTDRAYSMAGVPATKDFYVLNGHRQVPEIPNITFGTLKDEYIPRARFRYDTFGYGKDVDSDSIIARRAYQRFADKGYQILVEFLANCIKSKDATIAVSLAKGAAMDIFSASKRIIDETKKE